MVWVGFGILATATVTLIAWVINGIATVARDEITEPIDDLDP